MSTEVYKIDYKNRSWELRSTRYYSAEDITEAIDDFIYCFGKGRIGEKRLTVKRVSVWNRYSGRWDDVTRECVEYIEVAEPGEHVSSSIHKDNTISMRRI
jgi:hypothetical protein